MYNDNLAPNEFLYLFYLKAAKKLQRILELANKRKRTTHETVEIYEIKTKLVEAFVMLTMCSDDDTLKESFNYLTALIVSTDNNDIEYALEYCDNIRIKG
jgi:hypothetical protein